MISARVSQGPWAERAVANLGRGTLRRLAQHGPNDVDPPQAPENKSHVVSADELGGCSGGNRENVIKSAYQGRVSQRESDLYWTLYPDRKERVAVRRKLVTLDERERKSSVGAIRTHGKGGRINTINGERRRMR